MDRVKELLAFVWTMLLVGFSLSVMLVVAGLVFRVVFEIIYLGWRLV